MQITLTRLCYLMLYSMALWLAFYSWKFVIFFLFYGLNIDSGGSLEPLWWSGSSEHHNLCFSHKWGKYCISLQTLLWPIYSGVHEGGGGVVWFSLHGLVNVMNISASSHRRFRQRNFCLKGLVSYRPYIKIPGRHFLQRLNINLFPIRQTSSAPISLKKLMA